jgi:transposase
MDGSKEQPHTTAGLDLGDKYSHVCLIDSQSGEVIEEGRLRTSPEAFGRRFASEQPLRIAIEAGTHSPWASRVLEECAHEILVANPRKLNRKLKPNLRQQARDRPDRCREPGPPGASGSEALVSAQAPGRGESSSHGLNTLA